MTQQKIEELGWTVYPHEPDSPDKAASDYNFLGSMEQSLSNMQFTSIQHVRKWVGDFFASTIQGSETCEKDARAQ